MFKYNFNYELKLLIRSNWLLILFLGIGLLFAFGTYNGNKNVSKRLDDIASVKGELQKQDSIMLATLDKIEAGEKLDLPYWKLPSEPMAIGYSHPRVAIMSPEKMAFVATGQSDMYTHFKSPKVYGSNFALDYSEMVNPVQLLFGNFDLAFAIIYILPLLVIAFTYNVLSKEKELGTLRLLGAQPISIVKWLVQKMGIRYLLFTTISCLMLIVSIGFLEQNAFGDIGNLIGLLFILAAYILFWFVLAVVVNIKINNSSKNAFALIGIWLLIVLILPAAVNQIGNSLYPTPSRLNMINEIRLLKNENEKKQNEIMDDYLRTHPELAATSNREKFGFWHMYMASEKVVEEKTKPILATYENQLKKQQNLISAFQYLSPAIIMQQTLNNIAGTSEKHYNDYKKQVFEFSLAWKDYLVPMLFKEKKFTKTNYTELPKFEYKNNTPSVVWMNIIVIALISLVILFIGLIRNSSKRPENILQ
ncbi:MAG: DUF3526 domain-containing protein [Flavobacteriaceae bacterium]|nr:DUF3526 domain-containing protein [Flavobacteriaceae bacterium]